MRGISGLGGGFALTVAAAIVRDSFKGRTFQMVTTLTQAAAVIGPLFAPAIGAMLIEYLSWRWIFILEGGAILLTLIPFFIAEETWPKEKRQVENVMQATIQAFGIAVGGDTLAYFVGSAVGGPKLCPRISPNKTIAGSVGGLLGSVLMAVLVGRIFAAAAPDLGVTVPLWAEILLGFIGGCAGQMGDLFASMVKRHCKVKDYGTIFPGHGGMMDRLDSVFFVAIVVYCFRVILLA
jgi:CDP-diglyceride synthetase